jgi:hypothetical protein
VTALQLLAYIFVALLLQLVVGSGVAVWRARRISVLISAPADRAAPHTNTGAWPGWREFRVARRVFEDARSTPCSFYLEPADGQPLTPFKPGRYLTFSLAEMKDPVKDKLKRFGLFSRLGEERFFATLGEAVGAYLEGHHAEVTWTDWEERNP